MQPVYSIVIPCYNPQPDDFAACLESVAALQGNISWEVLLIVSGDDPAIAAMAQEASRNDSRIQVLSTPNYGVCHSRNLGIDKARGRWILFLDADDTLKPDLLLQLQAATQKEDDLVFFGFEKHLPDGSTSAILFEEDDAIHAAALQNGGGLCWNKAWRRGFLQSHKLRFNESLKLAEDIEFVLRTLVCHPVVRFLDAPLYTYYIHPGSVSQRYRKDMAQEYLRSMQAIAANKRIQDDIKNAVILDHLIFTVLKYSFRKEKGSYAACAKELAALLETQPYKQMLESDFQQGSRKQKILFQLLKHRQYPALKLAAWLYGRRRT